MIGAKIVVVHPGRLPKDYPRDYLGTSRINLLTSLNLMAKIAGRMGIKIAVENSPRGRAHRLVATPQEHLYILRKVASPHIGALLDLGHAHTWGLDLKEYIRILSEEIILFHIHDNHGSRDEHLPLGKGNMDLKGVMEGVNACGKEVPLILVMRRWGDVRESLSQWERLEGGVSLWRRLFGREAALKN